MRILEGVLELMFQGETTRCPIAGVREYPAGGVEVAIATPFGLRRVSARLKADKSIAEAHTFAFDYESGEVTRFELDLQGGPRPDDERIFDGRVSGGNLQGEWTLRELGAEDDEGDEAAQGLGAGLRGPPAEITPAPLLGE